jgi:type VI protein secretion system component VasK
MSKLYDLAELELLVHTRLHKARRAASISNETDSYQDHQTATEMTDRYLLALNTLLLSRLVEQTEHPLISVVGKAEDIHG